MKPGGGLKALVLGMGPAKGDEPDMDDKPMGEEEIGDDPGLTAAGDDLIAAIKSGDGAAVGRALKDAQRICSAGYSEPAKGEESSEGGL